MNIHLLSILIIVFITFCSTPYSQTLPEGNDYVFNDTVVLPVNYNKEKKYLLAICLHGLFGSGKTMAKDFSPYSRYMNMILACPNGNIPDPSRNATKWGNEDSVEYLQKYLIYIKNKYNVSDNPFLIGFSQGANQALYIALRDPTLWKTVAILSGGYSDIPKDNVPNISQIKVLFISGDTGPGEVYTLKKMKERLELLHSHSKIKHIIVKGHTHATSTKFSYPIFKWYASQTKNYSKSFWIFKGDFLSEYTSGEQEFLNGNYESSYEYLKKSLKINPVYPPAVFRFSHTSLLAGKMKDFKKSFYSALELYSQYPEFPRESLGTIFEDIRITLRNDIQLRNRFISFLENNLRESESSLDSVFVAEINLLLAYLHRYSSNFDESFLKLDTARSIFQGIEGKSSNFKDFEIQKKIETIENF
jgi:predicted esterase